MNFSPAPIAIIAKAATISEVIHNWDKLRSAAKTHASDTIKLVNLGRQIGVELQMLCGHEQLRMSFYENIKSQLPETLTFESAQRCIAIARAHPESLTTIEQALECEQTVLLLTGIMESPHRSGPQTSHDSTPDAFIWNVVASAKDRMERRLAEKESWDSEMRASVKKQLHDLKLWIEQAEAGL